MPVDDAELREFMREIRAGVGGVREELASLRSRLDSTSVEHGRRLDDIEGRLRLAEKHEDNARRIAALEVRVDDLCDEVAAIPVKFATKDSVAKAFDEIKDLQMTKARVAGLLAGAAAAGGITGGLAQLLASALGG